MTTDLPVGTLAILEGNVVWPIETKVEEETFLFTGQSIYEWDGKKWVHRRTYEGE